MKDPFQKTMLSWLFSVFRERDNKERWGGKGRETKRIEVNTHRMIWPIPFTEKYENLLPKNSRRSADTNSSGTRPRHDTYPAYVAFASGWKIRLVLELDWSAKITKSADANFVLCVRRRLVLYHHLPSFRFYIGHGPPLLVLDLTAGCWKMIMLIKWLGIMIALQSIKVRTLPVVERHPAR